jgi:sugar phosphate isomerase/epimerase
MRVAISNIAWDVNEDGLVAKLLNLYKIDAIDIAPNKYFPKPAEATTHDVIQVKKWWLAQGIELTGMQALLYGTNGFNIFGSPAIQTSMLTYLTEICRIGSILGASRLVFGSPKNRDCSGLNENETTDIALHFFKKLGDIAQSYGVETALFVELLCHPAIKMQFDVGALTINRESSDHILKHYAHLIGHIHLSEPNLIPIGDGNTEHSTIADLLELFLPNQVVTIEMLATKNEPHLESIERALNFAISRYRPNPVKTK